MSENDGKNVNPEENTSEQDSKSKSGGKKKETSTKPKETTNKPKTVKVVLKKGKSYQNGNVTMTGEITVDENEADRLVARGVADFPKKEKSN